MRRRSAATLAAAWLVGALVGCAPDPRVLEWTVSFRGPFGAGVARIEGVIRSDTCDGVVLHRATVRPSAAAPRGPTLPPGTYAWEAVALNATCEVIGRGCTVATLPSTSGTVHVVVAAEPAPVARCARSACADGECVTTCDAGACAPDAARPDGGHDAGTPRSDAGIDAGFTYVWRTGSWGSCSGGPEEREVYCERSDGIRVADGECDPADRPDATRACAVYCGPSEPTGTRRSGLSLLRGSCTDEMTCTGCSGGPTDDECGAYCAMIAQRDGVAYACEHIRCDLECRPYEGHSTIAGVRDVYCAFPP